MIVTQLLGGLGNQMFQYGAGLALAERHRTVLKLDVSWFRHYAEYEAHNRYALSCFNVTEQFATAEEVERARGFNLTRTERWLRAGAKRLRLNRLAARLESNGCEYRAPVEGCYWPGFEAIPDHSYIAGMWQSERFFGGAEHLLRLHFTFRYPPLPAVASMAERIRSGPSVAIHFRRGDYVRNSSFQRDIGVLSLDYYHRALALISAAAPGVTAFIFSDDLDAVEREFRPAIPYVFVRVTQPWHSYDKIRLMSQCDHAVISNSTFAWWAGWLNPNPNKIIIAPEPWLAGKPENSADTIPISWQRLPRQG